MYSNNVFNILRVAKMLNLARKIADETLRKDIIAKVDLNKKKKSIKIAFDIQKIIQKDNVLSYY